jgi:hypothetical protein
MMNKQTIMWMMVTSVIMCRVNRLAAGPEIAPQLRLPA